jgi:hypothetical protein
MEENSVLSIYDCEATAKHTLILSAKDTVNSRNEQKFSYQTLADKDKISIGSISNIIKCKPEYMESYEPNKSSTMKNNLRDEFSQ